MGPLHLTQRLKLLPCFSPCSYSKAKHLFLKHIANAKKFSYSCNKDRISSTNDALLNQILRPNLSTHFGKEALLKSAGSIQHHPMLIQHALNIASSLVNRHGHNSSPDIRSILSNGKDNIILWIGHFQTLLIPLVLSLLMDSF